MLESFALAAVLVLIVFIASVISAETGIAVAVLEVVGGMVAGNLLDLEPEQWLIVIAAIASVAITYLAGSEVDTQLLREELGLTLGLGIASFVPPLAAGFLVAFYGLGWDPTPSWVAAIALSETSVAVVYALIVQRGMSGSLLGKRLLAATFVTNTATAVALSLVFARPSLGFAQFVLISLALVVALPWVMPRLSARWGESPIYGEVRVVLVALILLVWSASEADGHALLPAFVLGLVMAGHYSRRPREREQLRVFTFSFLAPLFFVGSGLAVSFGALWGALGAFLLLAAAKFAPTIAAVWVAARRRMESRDALAVALLMSSGLTFGTITAVFGRDAGILDATQFSVVIGVVVTAAVVPTMAALPLLPQAESRLGDS